MDFRNLFSKPRVHISIVKHTTNGLVFHVKNGKGLICGKYGTFEGKGFFTLLYNKVPLIKFHGDEYLCPTCEKLVSAGLGLGSANEKTVYELSNALNRPFESIEKSFDHLKPLLGLLSTGYYMLYDMETIPTNGDGKFFWEIGNTPEINKATVPAHDDSTGDWNHVTKKYLLPTQSPRLFNPDRIDHYLKQDNTRAIAYALPFGYLCALLDGHHKACAAAIQNKPVKTLIIEPPLGLSNPKKSNGTKGIIYFSQEKLYADEMKESFQKARRAFASDVRLSGEETAKYLSMMNHEFDDFPWPDDLLKSASKYINLYTQACINWAGDLSDERIDRILNGEERPDEAALSHVIHALYGTNSNRFSEVAVFVGRNENYIGIWDEVFSLLSQIKTQQTADFFTEFLINDDKLRPWLTKIANDYFV